MDATDVSYAGANQQRDMLRSGALSVTELITTYLERIDQIDPTINSFRVVRSEQALQEARALDTQGPSEQGPLFGIAIAIKDNVDVAGEITTAGSAANTTPAIEDAPIVAAIREAGGVIIGKTTCSELTVWPFTENETWGITRNPWNTDYSPGGSSGGSGAAIAAGLCGIALGSDGLGSIRVPAGFNGVVGLKPNRGRVWHGPRSWHGLSANGPLARTVADTALFLDAVGTDLPVGGFTTALGETRPLRIAMCLKPMVDVPASARLGDEERLAVLTTASALEELGHTVVEHELSFSRKGPNNGMVRYLAGVEQNFQEVEFPERITKRTATMATIGRRIPRRFVDRALADEAGIANQLNAVFDDFDLVLTPGAVERPLRIGELDGKGALLTLRSSGKRIPHFGIWNVVGQPAMSVPAGFSSLGLPLSVQLAGKPMDELTLLQVATQLEKSQPWSQSRPPVSVLRTEALTELLRNSHRDTQYNVGARHHRTYVGARHDRLCNDRGASGVEEAADGVKVL